MDGIAHVARQQQSQVGSAENHARAQEQSQRVQHTEQTQQKKDLVKEMQKQDVNPTSHKVDSKDKMEDLVKKLNNALAPITTDIKFGVDMQDVFYVSVIDTKTDRMIRRFPAEKAQEFLPKMQEVSGILFDSKG